MSRHKKIKSFRKFEATYNTNWQGQGDTFECQVCGEDLVFPQRKCPYCGSTFKYEHAVLKLVKPVVVKQKEPNSYSLPWYKPEQPEPIPVVHSWSFKKWWSSSKGWRRLVP